jgi:hypothetical protein
MELMKRNYDATTRRKPISRNIQELDADYENTYARKSYMLLNYSAINKENGVTHLRHTLQEAFDGILYC